MAALLKLQFIIFSLIGIGFFTRRRGIAYLKETEEHKKCLAYGIICSNAGFKI